MQVVECVNADALVVKTADGVQKKIHFSSLRPPRYCSSNDLKSLADFLMHVAPGAGEEGVGSSQKNWLRLFGQLPKILTLFMTRMAKIDTLQMTKTPEKHHVL